MYQLTLDVIALLKQRDETIAVAESCTGGGLANAITSPDGLAKIFTGSITAYHNSVKTSLLHVPEDILNTKGAVCEDVACIMAAQCRLVFGSTWALSTTGIAGPTGGSEDKPVGLVWIGIAGPKLNHATAFNFAHCTRLEHRDKTILHALTMLKQALTYA